MWYCLCAVPIVVLLALPERIIHKYNLGYIHMEERLSYCVWPDDTKALLCEVSEGLYADKSDDYLTVSLTEEQYDVLTYDELVNAVVRGKIEVVKS
jgi:hypothetical protein